MNFFEVFSHFSNAAPFQELTKEDARVNEILTAQEVAAELRCSKAQVYKLMNGEVKERTVLPHIALGRKKVVRRSSFEAWKRANENRCYSLRRLRNEGRGRCELKESHATTVSEWLCTKIQGWSLLGRAMAGRRQATVARIGQGFENDEVQGQGETGRPSSSPLTSAPHTSLIRT